MRTRTALTFGLVAATALGSVSPALAAKAKPKPITGTYTAAATPDPTSTDVAGGAFICKPKLPGGKDSHAFKVPAAGNLHVEFANMLDWSLAVRDAQGNDLATSDGGTPDVKEMADVFFKKGQAITIDACNFSGEPTVKVTYTFTFK